MEVPERFLIGQPFGRKKLPQVFGRDENNHVAGSAIGTSSTEKWIS
jgi:hypothetical protein